MSLLPIAERELRVAARKRTTFWLRVITASVGLIIGAACLMLMHLGAFGPVAFGRTLFGILTWLSFFAVIAAGLFFTSDCLSEEKREGTLGLLFLTDLRGFDVVTGKLLGTSLRGFYALIGVFPVLATTLVMGGITGAQFWKSSLALLNALCFSLSAGMLVSAMSRDFQKALAGTLLLLLLFCVGGPLADAGIAAAQGRGFRPLFSLLSPGYLFISAHAWGRSAYWVSLLLNQAIAWSFFGLASLAIPHAWQERARSGPAHQGNWFTRLKYGGSERRVKLRRLLLDRNVVLWLACRERWQGIGMWLLSLATGAGFILIATYSPKEVWMIWGNLGGFILLLVYLGAASQASRFFVEAGRSGLTELLLATLVSEKEIVLGNWRALLRMCGWPVVLILGLNVIGTTFSLEGWRGVAAQTSAAISAVSATNSASTLTNSGAGATPTASSTNITISPTVPVTAGMPGVGLFLFALTCSGLPAAANLIALCWFGMWMGHSSRSGHLATLKTILFVQVLPWIVIQFVSYLGMVLLMLPFFSGAKSRWSSSWLGWWPFTNAAVHGLLTLAKDVVFISWARKKLYGSFREQATRNLGRAISALSRPDSPVPSVVVAGKTSNPS